MEGKGKFIVSTLFSFSEREKLNLEWERIRKAKWRASKLETDRTYCDKVQKYDRERKRKTSRNGDKITSLKGEGITSRKILSTPTKKSKPPSYYKVLSTSKKLQQLLGPSPNTQTTILKHVLSKAAKSPRKSKCMGKEFTSPAKSYVTPLKELVGKHLRKITILKSQKKYKEAKVVATSLRSRFKVAEIAALLGERIQSVYRLLSPEQKRRLQKEYVKKLTQEDKEEVINIYNDDEVSYSLPDIKYADLRFMHFTLREAYAVYVRKCQHQRIVAEKTFERLKPKNVRTIQETPLRDTRCEYCANFGKTRDVLIALGMKTIPHNHSEAI